LTNIWNYTYKKWSEKQADTYYEILLENCQYIADDPKFGKPYKEIQKNYLWTESKSTYHFL